MNSTTPFIEKLMEQQLKVISVNWFFEWYFWMINSSTRQFQRIDLFLKNQLDAAKVTDKAYQVAMSLRSKNENIDEARDETVFNIEEYVYKNYTYATDRQNYGCEELWATYDLIMSKMKDDCDGLNSLIFLLCRLAGIGCSCLWCVLGDTKYRYHFYCLYYSTKEEKLVSLDATILPQITPIKLKDNFKLTPEKYTRIDYIFNDEGSWRIQ